jgi:hypothetical protein
LIIRILIFLALFSASAALARPFDLRRDTLAFANETALQYGVDERGELHISLRDTPPRYAHRCFIMSRAVLQFWQFAQFAPEQPRVSREEYARLIRRISDIPVWSRGPKRKIVVPGFHDLHEFSTVLPCVLQENLGAWLPSYLRLGNWRMVMGHLRAGQAAAARWLEASLDKGQTRAIYIARFPHLNHCMVAFRLERKADGNSRFWLYDPNYPGKAAWLDYNSAERSFAFEPRIYFPGGRVNVMRVYLSPFH